MNTRQTVELGVLGPLQVREDGSQVAVPGAKLFTSRNMSAYIRASRDLTPGLSIHIEAVHRLSSFGAVVTDRVHETSPEGFDAEWRMIQLLTVEGDRINRCELFDETDLDAAPARFDQLD